MQVTYYKQRSLAERGGFEPPVELLTLRRFSKPLLSTTQPPLRKGCLRLLRAAWLGPITSDLSIKAWRVLSAARAIHASPESFPPVEAQEARRSALERGLKTKMLTDEGEHFV